MRGDGQGMSGARERTGQDSFDRRCTDRFGLNEMRGDRHGLPQAGQGSRQEGRDCR